MIGVNIDSQGQGNFPIIGRLIHGERFTHVEH